MGFSGSAFEAPRARRRELGSMGDRPRRVLEPRFPPLRELSLDQLDAMLARGEARAATDKCALSEIRRVIRAKIAATSSAERRATASQALHAKIREAAAALKEGRGRTSTLMQRFDCSRSTIERALRQ